MKLKALIISGSAIALAGGLFAGVAYATQATGNAHAAATTATPTDTPIITATPTPTAPAPTVSASPSPSASPSAAPAAAPAAAAAPAPSPDPNAPAGAPAAAPDPNGPVVSGERPVFVPADPQPTSGMPPGYAGYQISLMNPSRPYDPVTNPHPPYVYYKGCETPTAYCEESAPFFATSY